MVRFKEEARVRNDMLEMNLHSNMVRFKVYINGVIATSLIEFTFQYGKIQSCDKTAQDGEA